MEMKQHIAVTLLILFALSCKNKEEQQPIFNNEAIPVSLMPIARDSISSSFTSPGYFTTDDETQLSFKNGGIINKMYAGEGDRVRAGQILATVKGIETDALSRQAEIALEKARRDYERAKNLYRDSVATLEAMQNAQTALHIAQQQKAMAEFNRGQSGIVAASAGVVLKRFLNEGQMAGPGMPVFLFNPLSARSWMFKTGVSDQQWAALKAGDRVEITTNAFGQDQVITGSVFKKTQGVDPQTGSFSIRIRLNDHQNMPLAAGLFGEATLYPSKKISAWSVPYDAVLDADANKGYVFITNDKRHAKKVRVTILRLADDQVLISSGLEDARYLIISGSAYLNDGSVITVDAK